MKRFMPEFYKKYCFKRNASVSCLASNEEKCNWIHGGSNPSRCANDHKLVEKVTPENNYVPDIPLINGMLD